MRAHPLLVAYMDVGTWIAPRRLVWNEIPRLPGETGNLKTLGISSDDIAATECVMRAHEENQQSPDKP